MCKFNQNLFIVTILWYSTWLIAMKTVHASPIFDYLFVDDDDVSGGDYDMTFDQRQNGTENIRLKIDGVLLAFPSSSSSQASSAAGNLAANYLLQLAASGDDDDDEYFNFGKNVNAETGVTAQPVEKNTEAVRVQEQYKKKIVAKQPEHIKENSVKRVPVVKDEKVGETDIIQRTNPIVEESSKIAVIPVKKIQSRRKNK